MVHHIVLYKLKHEVTPARVEAMMMNTRMQLLKIPEVLSIKCGKRIDPETEWPFFVAIDFESMDKFAMFREDSIYVKFVEEVVKPNTEDSLTLDFEMDPGKDVRFSCGTNEPCDELGRPGSLMQADPHSYNGAHGVTCPTIAIRRATRNHRSQCGSVISILVTP